MTKRILPSPFDIVTKALNAEKDTITENSSLNEHPKWDSINHLDVIIAIEKEYKINIPNAEVMNYATMQAIIAKYEELSNQEGKAD